MHRSTSGKATEGNGSRSALHQKTKTSSGAVRRRGRKPCRTKLRFRRTRQLSGNRCYPLPSVSVVPPFEGLDSALQRLWCERLEVRREDREVVEHHQHADH